MKNKLVLFIAGCFALVLSSCLKSDEIASGEVINNCQIHSFSLSHDSVPGLDSVKFTIDQLTGQIFNIDSLPYGTVIDKVVCSIGFANSSVIGGVEVSPEAYPDSTYYLSSLSDTIDFSAPVKFVVHSYDQITTKVYTARVNIHQLEPDSMVWGLYADPMIDDIAIRDQKVVAYAYDGAESYFMYVRPAASGEPYRLYHAPLDAPGDWQQLSLTGLPADGLSLSQIAAYDSALYVPDTNGSLYRSEDGLAWSVVEGAPSVSYLMGSVREGTRQSSVLSAIVDREGTPVFYAMDESMGWTAGDAVPDGFPVTGFGSLQYASMYHDYLMVAGGRTADSRVVNTTWATSDGLSWTLMASGDANFTGREGAMVTRYDDKFFLIGGIDASDNALKDIYQSIDYGVSWSLVDTMLVLPVDYAARGFSSIIVDEANYVNIFGGKASVGSNDLNQLWRGRINRLIPKE